ncbi:hypothetical protein CJ030_MR3G025349 [Morella rubra]|uniref:non-specific serine/threonine protein kinase n=1 Tax=Morella rubra TaxID=262757 RepID=A0A6A1WDN2_9ROSI|nr:hypothetical protein CJ030_MR3G025349 [Morella rubra]
MSDRLPKNMFDHLPNLQELDVSGNQLDGELPSSLFKCKQLEYITLSSNKFTGRVPEEIGNLTALRVISLDLNNFEGEIPSEVGNQRNLKLLNMASNNFSRAIPFDIFNITTISVIDLNMNKLSGHLPSNMGLFAPNLQQIFLLGNELNGTIPSSRSNASQLTDLDLSENSFSGFIPETLGNLRLLQGLNLGFNKLIVQSTGLSLFSDLSNCKYLRVVTLSGNPLNNILPNSVGNLFSSLEQIWLSTCNITGNIPISVGDLSNLISLSVWRNELMQQKECQKYSGRCRIVTFSTVEKNFSPRTPTSNKWFSLNNLLGEGSFALEYLHHGCSTSIVHCDLKPSNILLDEDMVAHVADFGIAKLLGDGDSMTWTMTLATTGYMAPEYGLEGIVSTRGDMYSFGILLMETFTRKRPTYDMFIGEMSLKHWINASLPHSVIHIIDPNLLRNERDDDAVKECISSLMGLAMGCCAESSEQRTNIEEVSAALNKIKLKLLKDIGRN